MPILIRVLKGEGHTVKVKKPRKERAKETYVDPCYIAEIYAGLGENDQAFAWLEKAYEVRSEELLTLRIDPRFEGLRKDTRFAEFFRRMGLSP